MPEGPSLVILKEQIAGFTGKKVTAAGGNADIDMQRTVGHKIMDIRTWGKHLLLCFKDFTIRVHLMLFGSYRINEERKAKPKLHLEFGSSMLNFYACSVKLIEEPLKDVYDWTEDMMAEEWDAAAAKKKLKAQPDMLACDALMNQHIFSGSGNIIKNEVLFKVKIHPLSKVGKLPARQLTLLVNETSKYAFDFLKWKKDGVLKKHWLAYTKKNCPRCDIPLIKENLGKTHRRNFFCNNCQMLYE